MNIKRPLFLSVALTLSSGTSRSNAQDDTPIIWYAAQLDGSGGGGRWPGLCDVEPVEAGAGVYRCDQEAKLVIEADYNCPWGSAECNGVAADFLAYSDVWRQYYNKNGEVRLKYDSKMGTSLPPFSARPPTTGPTLDVTGFNPKEDIEFYYGHVQGVGRFQRSDAVWIAAASSHFDAAGRAGFWVAKLNARMNGATLPESDSDGKKLGAAVAFYPLEDTVHPGGLQVLGKYVLISKECEGPFGCSGRGGVEVWDLGDPLNGMRVKNVVLDKGTTTIPGSPDRASSLGATRLSDGRYLIAVAGRKTEELWFYMTRTEELTSDWLMVDHMVKDEMPSDVSSRWRDYQNLSMFADTSGKIYMLATQADGGAINAVREALKNTGPLKSLADLFKIGFPSVPQYNYFEVYEVLADPEHGVRLRFVPVDAYTHQENTFAYPMTDYCSAAGGVGAYVTPWRGVAVYCHSDIPNSSGEYKLLQLSRGVPAE